VRLRAFLPHTGRPPGGSGLGLSIVGRVVKLLGGDIELSAPATGNGLLVTIRLPFTDAQSESATAA
jgi:signal transduction histidine kinase